MSSLDNSPYSSSEESSEDEGEEVMEGNLENAGVQNGPVENAWFPYLGMIHAIQQNYWEQQRMQLDASMESFIQLMEELELQGPPDHVVVRDGRNVEDESEDDDDESDDDEPGIGYMVIDMNRVRAAMNRAAQAENIEEPPRNDHQD